MQTSLPAHIAPGNVNRRHFNSALAHVLIAAAVAAGCGSSAGSPTSPQSTAAPPATSGNITGVVSGNHGIPHVAIITAAQLAAAAPIVMDISNGLHSHTVALTAAQVGQIAGGTRVSQASSTDPHSNGSDPHQHTVTFN